MTYSNDSSKMQQLATQLRKLFGLETATQIDPVKLLDIAVAKNIINAYGVADERKMMGAEARFEPDEGHIYFSKEAYSQLTCQTPRGRFTAAHELAHAFLGHKAARNRMRQSFGNSRKIGIDEREANQFAGAFLVPESLANVTDKTTVSEVSETFGVSKQVAKIRLNDLQKLYRMRTGKKRPIPEYIQKEINKLNGNPHQGKTVQVGGDYEDYMSAIGKQSISYPDK